MRIGIDVGGTHTDAVLFEAETLRAATKAPTSADIATGVVEAAQEVLRQAGVAPGEVTALTIGTTQFTNAVVERRRLAPVAALRIGAQSSSAMPIAAKWPADIRAAVVAHAAMIDGGAEYDGALIKPTDLAGLDAFIAEVKAQGLGAVAITSVFAGAAPHVEQDAAARIRAALPHVQIAPSNALGGLGLHARENAAVLNAALMDLAGEVADAFETAFARLGVSCPLFMTQNDGTVMAASYARAFPVFTFSSGPTNSMRGAARLCGRASAMVIDIGGTTSDVGMLIDGFPRPSGATAQVGGVTTNFRMPDVLAVGLGGGSHVAADGTQVGPQSVGRELPQRGRVFGGDTLTASDIAVAAGRAQMGEPARVAGLAPSVVASAMARMRTLLEDAVDRMKTSAEPLPLIVVGGGAFLAPDTLAGASEVIRPPHAGVANAIGAAFAQIGGEAEAVYVGDSQARAQGLADAERSARERAAAAGAKADTLVVAEVDERAMSYTDTPGGVVRVKVVGDPDLAGTDARPSQAGAGA